MVLNNGSASITALMTLIKLVDHSENLYRIWYMDLRECIQCVAAVFGRKNKLTDNMELPKVVVISFYMLARLRESMLSRKWGMVIVDEAHNLRCTRKKVECDEVCLVSFQQSIF